MSRRLSSQAKWRLICWPMDRPQQAVEDRDGLAEAQSGPSGDQPCHSQFFRETGECRSILVESQESDRKGMRLDR